jgi:hypothetical protein
LKKEKAEKEEIGKQTKSERVLMVDELGSSGDDGGGGEPEVEAVDTRTRESGRPAPDYTSNEKRLADLMR